MTRNFCKRVGSLSRQKRNEYLDKSIIIPNIIQFPRQFKIAPENCCVHGILIWWSEAGVIDVSKNRLKIAVDMINWLILFLPVPTDGCIFPWSFFEGLDEAFLNIFVFRVYFKGAQAWPNRVRIFLHKSNLYGLVTWEQGQKKIFVLFWALYYPLIPEIFA